MKKYIISTVLVIASIFGRFAVVEVGARAYLAYVYLLGNYKSIATYEIKDTQATADPIDLGWGKPNTTDYYYMFDEDSRITLKTTYHFNNAGLVSHHDYLLDKTPNEYRIVILGDSFTAALQMNTPWPDRLEDMLNQDEQLKTKLGGKTIHVYNFGLFSAGFPEFQVLAKSAARLKPDMIIVNYVSAAIGVCNQCNDSADTPLKDKERSLYSGEIPIDIDGQGKDIGYLKISCETLPIDLSNDTCSHSYNLVLPPDLAANPDKVRAIKRTIVKRYLRGKLVSSLYPYCWDLVRGKMPSVNELRHPEWFGNGHKSWTLTEPQMVQQAVDNLRAIRDLFPGKVLLATLHPTYDDLTGKPSEKLTGSIRAAVPDIPFKLMREYLPQGRPAEEMHAWYCLPNDGHMNDTGGELYARAMERVVHDALPQ